jgi:hypothetical protein
MLLLGSPANLARAARPLQALTLALSLSLFGCGEGFDPGSEVKSLRVLGVHKDQPYPQPGEEVNLTLLWADGLASERSEPVQVSWLMQGSPDSPEPSCINPPGDLFYSCFQSFGGNVGIHSGSTFRFTVPNDIVSSRPAPMPGQPAYGLVYAFFAVCAGQLGFAVPTQEGALPLVCRNAQGEQLGPDDFVAGYTSLYVFEKVQERDSNGEVRDKIIRNKTPEVMDGFEVAGNMVESDCVGTACVGADAPIPFDDEIDCAAEPTRCFPACNDDGDSSCPKIKVRPLLDSSIAERDEVSAKYYSRDVGEQMWINYYVDRGSLKSEARLLNDASTGWNADYGTDFYAPKEPGPVTLWSVVHDNRGGTNWVRARLQIQ